MSTNHGDDDRGDSITTPWFSNPFLLILVVVAPFIAIFLVLAVLSRWLGKPPIRWCIDRIAKSRQPVYDGHELVECRGPVEDPRKSEESIGTRYEFEKPVENNAKLEV